MAFWYLKGVYKIEQDRYFSEVCCDRRQNGFKLKEGRFKWDRRKKFFVSIVRCWNRLTKEVLHTLFLKTFQVGLRGI